MVRVATGARLHFGFGNLSLSHERLYGALGVGLDTPEVVVEATPAETVHCDDPTVRAFEKAGFKEVKRWSKTRPIMRYVVRKR